MYGLSQYGRIAHDAIVKYLNPYEYCYSRKPWVNVHTTVNQE